MLENFLNNTGFSDIKIHPNGKADASIEGTRFSGLCLKEMRKADEENEECVKVEVIVQYDTSLYE